MQGKFWHQARGEILASEYPNRLFFYPNGAAKAQNIPKYPPGYRRGPT
jgi:hypothetical protein